MIKKRSYRWVKIPITEESNDVKDGAETVLYFLSFFEHWYGMKDSQDLIGVLYEAEGNLNQLVSPELKEWAENSVKSDTERWRSMNDKINEWLDKYKEEKEKNKKLRIRNKELSYKIKIQEKAEEKKPQKKTSKEKSLKFNTKRKD